MSNFSIAKVSTVSSFLQLYMQENNIENMSADECAELLAAHGILSNKVGPKPGFNFRQMLRDGRDGKIPLVTGAFQRRPNTRWTIRRVEGDGSVEKNGCLATLFSNFRRQ